MELEVVETGALGTNTYVLSENNEAVIVDAGEYSSKVTKYIKENNLVPKFLILTHGHGDHIGGVSEYKKVFPKMQIVAGIKEKKMLENSKLNYSKDIFGEDKKVDVDIFVKDGDELKLGNLTLKVIETPGHPRGGISIFISENNIHILFSGDTLFAESVGRADFPESSWNDLVRSISEKLYALPDDTEVLPGHGPATTIEYEKKHNPFVRPSFNDPYAEETT